MSDEQVKEIPIAEGDRIKCELCSGTGKRQQINFRENDAGSHEVNCYLCTGRGWVYAPQDDERALRDEISWLQEAAHTMRKKLDARPDNLGPESDWTALRILAKLERIARSEQALAALKGALEESRRVLVIDNEYAADSNSVLAIDAALRGLASEQWYAGSNEEQFNMGPFDSRDEAISEGRNCWPDSHFWIGQAGQYHPFSRDYVEEMLELEACDVSDECGSDAVDNWPPRFSRKDADCAAANEKIVAILKELCGECTVFPIEGSERIDQAEATR